MTLQEWCQKTNTTRTYPDDESGTVCVAVVPHNYERRSDLWHLDDYAVSTVSGPIVYLVPRTRPPFWKEDPQ